MNKKVVSIFTLVIILTTFISFPVFAVTGGGKTIVSNSYSYNNGDVTVYVRVNGNAAEDLYEGQHYYPHNFTITLANNTNKFQVADANNFSIDLYSGTSNAFASNQNSWGAEVTSYSDNMTVPRITMYPTGDLSGHVLVAFNDSDLLVLNPNETRTYNFSINFIQTENINYTPLNGNYRYSYFTYTGTVGFYARPTTFSGNTVDDFISNNSFPNSAIFWFMNAYEQGIIDQEKYDEIISILNTRLTTAQYNYVSFSGTSFRYNQINDSGLIRSVSSIYGKTDVVNADFEYSGSNVYNSQLLRVPQYIFINFNNTNDYPVSINSTDLNFTTTTTVSNGTYLFNSFEFDDNGIIPYQISVTNNNCRAYLRAPDNTNTIIPAHSSKSVKIVVYRYYQLIDSTTYCTITFSNLANTWSTITVTQATNDGSYPFTFGGIINRLQDILNAYNANKPQAEDVTGEADDVTNDIENQHHQETTYYSDTNTAINNSGLDTYTFDSSTSSGLNGLKNDFTLVWNACGSLGNVWILSLTLSLALYIIRHRRMFHV